MQPVKAMMTIQIPVTLLKVHILWSQIDIKATKFHLEDSSSNKFLILKKDLTLSNGNLNSKKIAHQMIKKTTYVNMLWWKFNSLPTLIIWFKLILNWTQSTLKTVKEKILLSTGISMIFKQTKLSGQIQTAWKCKQEFWITEIPTSMRLIKIFHQTIIQSAQLLLLDQKINKQPWWLKDQRLEVLN